MARMMSVIMMLFTSIPRRLLLFGLLCLFFGGVFAVAQDRRPLYALPSGRAQTSSTMALVGGDGRVLAAANMLNNTVSIVRPGVGQVIAEIPVGRDPRSVAATPDGERALVVNRGDGTLSVINLRENTVSRTIPLGVLPYAIVTNNNNTAYVSLQGSAEVIRIDLTTGEISERYSVPEFPAGLALWGDFLYVTHFWSGELTLVYLPQKTVARTISTGLDTGLFQSVEIDSTRGVAYLPQSRSAAANRQLTYDTVIFPLINRVDLTDMSLLRRGRLTLDTADRPVNMPFAAAVDANRRALYVVNAGSDSLSVIDLTTGFARAHIAVGSNPRGVLLSRDGGQIYVHNVLDGTITIIEAGRLTVSDVLPISNLTIPVDVLIGAQLFYGAGDARLSKDDRVSCASCHFDGQPDGRTWLGFAGGARNTPHLFNLIDTAPYTWTGAWDELSDVEFKVRRLMAGTGLIAGPLNDVFGASHAGLSLDMDALVVYLTTLQGPPNPIESDPEQVAQGREIFNAQGCSACHSGSLMTDLQAYDVGTGGVFDTPSLRYLWLSAPYLHDGRASGLYDVFALPGAHQLIGTHTQEEISALVNYLLSQ